LSITRLIAMAIRVFIVDDHLLFRTGLRALLAENGVETVGDAGDAGPALQRIATLQPDVVLMDLSLPGMSGVEATRRLSELAPDVSVLILTVTTPDHTVVDAVRAGAVGYLLKDTPTADLVRAVGAAARGRPTLSRDATAVVLDAVRASTDQPQATETDFDLTWRELEVLALLVEGKENRAIAGALSISPPTVKHHISNVLAKLNVPNRTLAAVQAVSRGLVLDAADAGSMPARHHDQRRRRRAAAVRGAVGVPGEINPSLSQGVPTDVPVTFAHEDVGGGGRA
jgi:DNA-binding NarL/FixJ family response regulator